MLIPRVQRTGILRSMLLLGDCRAKRVKTKTVTMSWALELTFCTCEGGTLESTAYPPRKSISNIKELIRSRH